MNKTIVMDAATFPPAFDEALNAGDLDRLLMLHDPEVVLRASDGTTGRGLDALRQEMQKLIAAKAELHNKLRHVFQSGETALIVVDWTLSLNTPDGQQIKNEGTATNVIHRDADKGWRMLISNPRGTA